MCSAMALAQEVGTIISLDGGAQRYDEEMKLLQRQVTLLLLLVIMLKSIRALLI